MPSLTTLPYPSRGLSLALGHRVPLKIVYLLVRRVLGLGNGRIQVLDLTRITRRWW